MSDEITLGGAPATPEEAGYVVAVSQKASTAYVKQVVGIERTRAEGIESGLDARIAANEAALEALGGLENGTIAEAVAGLEGQISAEATARGEADAALQASIDTLNGNDETEGSVAKAVKDAVAAEEDLRVAADEALDARLDVIEGEGAGSVAKAEADAKAYAKEYTDAREVVLQGNIDALNAAKVDKVTGSSLIADTEIAKLALYPAYSVVEADIAAKAVAANTYTKTEVDNAISAAKASVLRYQGTATKAELDAISGGKITVGGVEKTVVAGDVYHVDNAGTNGAGAEFVWNGTAWEELGTAVDLTAYYTSAQTDAAIAAAVLIEENRAKGVESGLSDAIALINGNDQTAGSFAYAVKAEETRATGVESGLDTRLTAAEGEIDSLQGVLGNLTTAGSVEAALDTKVDKVTGSSLVPDAEITKLAGLDDMTTLQGKLDLKANAADVASALATKVDKQPVVSTAVQALEAGKRYVVKGNFAGTLPEAPADGAIVEIFVLVGGANRTVAAAGSDKVLGQSALPCAIGVTEEGWAIDNETYTFIYDATNTNWHVL